MAGHLTALAENSGLGPRTHKEAYLELLLCQRFCRTPRRALRTSGPDATMRESFIDMSKAQSKTQSDSDRTPSHCAGQECNEGLGLIYSIVRDSLDFRVTGEVTRQVIISNVISFVQVAGWNLKAGSGGTLLTCGVTLWCFMTCHSCL